MPPITSKSSWYLWLGISGAFLFPHVFRATSYIKTTNGIIKEIDTVLELEGILEIVLGVHFAEGH